MTKPKTANFEIGDTVYHIVNEEKTPGIVVGKLTRGPLAELEVDFGPNIGTSVHYEYVLRDTFVQKFGDQT